VNFCESCRQRGKNVHIESPLFSRFAFGKCLSFICTVSNLKNGNTSKNIPLGIFTRTE
jgi:hypothetical protein